MDAETQEVLGYGAKMSGEVVELPSWRVSFEVPSDWRLATTDEIMAVAVAAANPDRTPEERADLRSLTVVCAPPIRTDQ